MPGCQLHIEEAGELQEQGLPDTVQGLGLRFYTLKKWENYKSKDCQRTALATVI